MSDIVTASEGTNIIVLDREDWSTHRIPVVAFQIMGSIAYPICATATGGLLKATRALEQNGYITDRGFPVPFDSDEAWVQWARHVEPGNDEADTTDVQEQAERPPTEEDNQQPEETAHEKAARLRAQNAPTMENTGPKPVKARKTFASKSFWSRTNTQGVLEVVEIEAGLGLPRDSEGFEKIKRDDFANYKRSAKTGEAAVIVIGWDDGPVTEGSVEDASEVDAEDGNEDDFGGLV